MLDRIPEDKRLHFWACFNIALWGGLTHWIVWRESVPAMLSGFLTAFVVGLVKEIVWDRLLKRGTPDAGDFEWDVYGAAAGMTTFGLLVGG